MRYNVVPFALATSVMPHIFMFFFMSFAAASESFTSRNRSPADFASSDAARCPGWQPRPSPAPPRSASLATIRNPPRYPGRYKPRPGRQKRKCVPEGTAASIATSAHNRRHGCRCMPIPARFEERLATGNPRIRQALRSQYISITAGQQSTACRSATAGKSSPRILHCQAPAPGRKTAAPESGSGFRY